MLESILFLRALRAIHKPRIFLSFNVQLMRNFAFSVTFFALNIQYQIISCSGAPKVMFSNFE